MNSMGCLDELQFKKSLLQKIESQRIMMNRIGIEKGFNDNETIKISQKLDQYILKYQSLENF